MSTTVSESPGIVVVEAYAPAAATPEVAPAEDRYKHKYLIAIAVTLAKPMRRFLNDIIIGPSS